MTAVAVDPGLIVAARSDESAFAQLYGLYGSRIYNYVLRSVREPQGAEDVCQEVWIKAHQQLRKLREPAAFSTWLYRIASRACIDHARSRPKPMAELEDDSPASISERPEEVALRTDSERLIWEALGSLPVRQHQALYLCAIEGRSYKEIAAILETSVSAVETLLFRARTRIAKAYTHLDAITSDRCVLARKSMVRVIDGEATAVQQHALDAHVDGCRDCRSELHQMRRATAAYSALPLLPLPALLGERIFEGIGALGTSMGGGLLAKTLALVSTKVKTTTAAVTIGGGIAATSLMLPADQPLDNVAPASLAASVVGTTAVGAPAAPERTGDSTAMPASHPTGLPAPGDLPAFIDTVRAAQFAADSPSAEVSLGAPLPGLGVPAVDLPMAVPTPLELPMTLPIAPPLDARPALPLPTILPPAARPTLELPPILPPPAVPTVEPLPVLPVPVLPAVELPLPNVPLVIDLPPVPPLPHLAPLP